MTDRELQQALLERLSREPVAPQPKPRESFSLRLAAAAMVVVVIIAASLALVNFLAPLVAQPASPQAAPTAYPTVPPYQPASAPQTAPQVIYVQQDAPPAALPQATTGVVIVVTPTFAGCHDGVSYVNGAPTNGTCGAGAYAPEEATPEPMAATAVPPDPAYLQTIREQQPHKIR